MALTKLKFQQGELDLATLGTFANSTATTVLSRLGRRMKTLAGFAEDADEVIANIGMEPPVAYAGGLTISRKTQTVLYGGMVYAPRTVPLTTPGSFNEAQWFVIGGNSAVGSRALLKAAPTNIQVRFLRELGREGTFIWDNSVPVATHQGDPLEGVYIAPSSAADGAWVRFVPDNEYLVQWWGTSPARNDNNVPINAAFKVVPAGATLRFPPYTCVVSSKCESTLDKAVHCIGADNRTTNIVPSTQAATYYTFQIMASNSSVRRMGFGAGGDGTSVANEPAALAIGKFQYRDPVGNVTVPGAVSNILVDDCWTEGGDTGIIVGPYFPLYRNGFVANMPAGIYSQHRDFYLISNVTVRNCHVRALRNGLAFYAAVNSREYNNTVVIADHQPNVFSSGIRILGCINMDSHNSIFRYDVEQASSSYTNFGVYYALAGFSDGEGKLGNYGCRVYNHTIIGATIPLELGTWQGGSLEIDNIVIRNTPTVNNPYPLIRCDVQGDIVNRKRTIAEGFSKLHITNIDAIGGSQFISITPAVKDLLIANNKWISNGYSTNDGRSPISIRDLTFATDADGNPFAQKGLGLIRILDNELLSYSVAYNEISIIEASANTRAIVQGNRTVPSSGGGVPRASIVFTGEAGATIVTDGVTEQAAGGTIDHGLNYYYPTGTWALAVSGDPILRSQIAGYIA